MEKNPCALFIVREFLGGAQEAAASSLNRANSPPRSVVRVY